MTEGTLQATTVDKKRNLLPGKLCPPPEAMKRIVEKGKGKLPNNPILRFFKIFFGEGF